MPHRAQRHTASDSRIGSAPPMREFFHCAKPLIQELPEPWQFREFFARKDGVKRLHLAGVESLWRLETQQKETINE